MTAGNHEQGCILADDHHPGLCLTTLPIWYDAECTACERLYGSPRFDCEDLCMVECIGACGVLDSSPAASHPAPPSPVVPEGDPKP